MFRGVFGRVRRLLNSGELGALPLGALEERRRDRLGLPEHAVEPSRAIDEAIAWLGRAQDHSRTKDGGVARHFSLINGWSSSYPETTGYIVPTLLDYARWRGGAAGDDARRRARAMLDWLVSIQYPDGPFQGGVVDSTPRVPVTFNTGQILMGLAAGVKEFGEAYREPMTRAADWLLKTQDADGCWRKYPTPFVSPGEKAYETHVAWGLLEAARVGKPDYAEAALRNIRWALTLQRTKGWFDCCSMGADDEPSTHALGYVLRGILEGYRTSRDPAFLKAAIKTADGLMTGLERNGRLPGAFYPDWSPAASWVCLTGSLQIAICWLMLYQETKDTRYRDAGRAANAFVRRTMKVDGPAETRGGIKGSFPVDGLYGSFEFVNWAAKFFIDSHLTELTL